MLRRVAVTTLFLGFILAAAVAADEVRLGIRPILGVQTDLADTAVNGLTVEAVMPGSIADRMGMVAGDHLVSLNGRKMAASHDIRDALEGLVRGDKLVARFMHDGKEIEKEDALRDVPTLPGYELVEGVGIDGVARIGDTRAQLDKILGPPAGEIKGTGGIVYLGYPPLGLTIGLMPAPTEFRVVLVRVQYPFVGRTRHGVLTTGPREALKPAYEKDGLQQQSTGREVDGFRLDVVPGLGIRFASHNNRIEEVMILPPAEAFRGPPPRQR